MYSPYSGTLIVCSLFKLGKIGKNMWRFWVKKLDSTVFLIREETGRSLIHMEFDYMKNYHQNNGKQNSSVECLFYRWSYWEIKVIIIMIMIIHHLSQTLEILLRLSDNLSANRLFSVFRILRKPLRLYKIYIGWNVKINHQLTFKWNEKNPHNH